MEDKQLEPGVEEQAVEAAEPQPSHEDLVKEIERKEAEIQRLQGVLKAEQKRGVSRVELEALTSKIDSLQEWNAEIFDDLAARIGGEYDEPKPTKKSYKQALEDRRKVQSPPDPDAQAFFDYIKGEGLSVDDDIVQEAAANKGPREALMHLKEKMKEQSKTEIETLAEKKANDLLGPKLRVAIEAELKAMGLTASGVGAPSAQSTSDEDFLNLYSAGKSDDHVRARKIMQGMT